MKKLSIFTLFLFTSLTFSSCDTLQEVVNSALSSSNGGSAAQVSTGQIIMGLKEALTQGTTKGVNVLSVKDGFFKNPSVKIFFPPEAQKVEKTLRDIGMGSIVDQAIEKLNRAAEDATKGAGTIFVNAIKQMTINDAKNILMGSNDAATQYLKRTTSTQLENSFNPVIRNSLNKVGALDAWNAVITRYNQVPFVEKVNPNLDQYVTGKAMDGVFMMIQKEEALIRKDPVKRVSDLLRKVFALQDK